MYVYNLYVYIHVCVLKITVFNKNLYIYVCLYMLYVYICLHIYAYIWYMALVLIKYSNFAAFCFYYI